jgi:hypothetical protein
MRIQSLASRYMTLALAAHIGEAASQLNTASSRILLVLAGNLFSWKLAAEIGLPLRELYA